MVNQEVYSSLKAELDARQVTLVAVSKLKPASDIQALYDLGHRDFGENYVQELSDKQAALPRDIRWHFIGHLQRNKVKYIAPFVHLIHGIDSFPLLQEVNKQAAKNGRVIDLLLQVHIAAEETKFGLDEKELVELMQFQEAQSADLQQVRICGVMGMATATDDPAVIRAEFEHLHGIFRHLKQTYFLGKPYFETCSMGMSGDYKIAVDAGSTLVRIGSMLFGNRS